MTTVYESNRFAFQVSWGSILAGSAVALVTYLIFSVLGTAIGAQAVDMMQKGNPLSGFGTGTGIWLLVSTLASLAAGAFVAGRTAPNRGGLHGLLSWAITTLLTTWLMRTDAAANGKVQAAERIAGLWILLQQSDFCLSGERRAADRQTQRHRLSHYAQFHCHVLSLFYV